ncbi:MAG: DUF3179 domain-containing (seleno)protein [Bacillota bacterium]
MFLPLLLLFSAAFASAIVAYGTHPVWAQYRHGLSLILFARQFEWPLAALALVLCVTVVALVVAGKRRAWWLIGLGPVLALFVHRYQTDPLRDFYILANPAFVPAVQASFMAGDDYVVGVVFEGSAYAYPYFALYSAPVVFQTEHDRRMILMWSAFANRAVAWQVNRAYHPRDLEIISMPANALLVYNVKLGQFINGLTGCTPAGQKPEGFLSSMPVQKVTWRQWASWYPTTQVLVPPGGVPRQKVPNAPLRPWFPYPPITGTPPAESAIVLLETPSPQAILPQLVKANPMNLSVGGIPMLVFRDRATGRVRAFDRRVEDLTLKFKLNTDARRKQAVLVDLDTNSGWLTDGRPIDGPMAKAGKRLQPINVDEFVYWGVMKTWMPQLQLVTVEPTSPVVVDQAGSVGGETKEGSSRVRTGSTGRRRSSGGRR